MNTLDAEKVISPLYRNTLSPVAAVVQQERKDASILQLHLLSHSKSIARSHHLIGSFETGWLLFLKVQPVSERSGALGPGCVLLSWEQSTRMGRNQLGREMDLV